LYHIMGKEKGGKGKEQFFGHLPGGKSDIILAQSQSISFTKSSLYLAKQTIFIY